MKAIVNTAPDRLEWLDLPLSQPGPGEVRIRTGACGICATDLAMIAGWERTGFPSVPGHEWAGTVDKAGEGVSDSLVGRRCVAENVLSDGGEVGFEHPGGYGEYLITEASRVHPLPGDFPLAAGVLIEPLAVCVRALRRLRSGFEEPVLIFGDGPIGLILLMLLARQGVRQSVLVGGRPHRLSLAAEIGASQTWNYHDMGDSRIDSIKGQAGGEFPTVIEASGSARAMEAAMEIVETSGRILVVGDYGQAQAAFLWNRIIHREIEMIGSNASTGAWPEAVRLAAGGELPLERLISHCLPARRFEKGMALLRNDPQSVLKVVLEWEPQGT
ncbi:MAG: zinc-binding dehydrogenase [Armatimonadetes bacterium]|nr:zinc-binding dehydrogenase [Armatimonadota bacterium]